MKKIAFTTCVQLGLSCIEEIVRIGGKIDLLITLSDEKDVNKSGRVYLDNIAHKENIDLIKINNINDAILKEELLKHDIDWLFIIGWSQIAKSEILNTPKLGCIGMHPTLLPEGRGRASIPWAILKGLSKTGVTLFKLDEGVDTGDIIGQGIIEIEKNCTAKELYEKVDKMHVDLISEFWDLIVNDKISLVKQDESKATLWPGRKPSDGEITSNMTMDEADKLVRAVTHPYPGAFYKNSNNTLRVWRAKFDSKFGQIKLNDGYLIPIEYEIEE